MNNHSDAFREKQPEKKRDLRLMARLYPFIRPQLSVILCAVGVIILVTLLDLAAPLIIKTAIDRYIVPSPGTTARTSAPGTEPQSRYLQIVLDTPQKREIVNTHRRLFADVDESSALIHLDRLGEMKTEDIRILRKADMTRTALAAGLIVVIALALFFLNAVQVLVMEYAGQRTMHQLRMKVFTHIQDQSLEYFSRNPVGRLLTRATNDIQNMHEMFTSVITFVFNDLFLIFGIIVVMMMLSWKLALACLMVIPLVALAATYFATVARTPYRRMRVKIAEINAQTSETIEGMSVLQLFSRTAGNYEKFQAINRDYYDAGIKQIHVFAVFMPVIDMLWAVSLAIIIYFGGRGVLSETMTIGVLAAFISYIKMFFRPLRDMAEKFNIIQNAISSAERIFLVLDMDTRLPQPQSQAAVTAENFRIHHIRLEHVSFAYQPDEPVLNDISFAVARGETVAIVGPTGAGKTSIANLLLRFYDVNQGSVLINGVDIRQIPSSILRARTGLVSQDPFLFTGTIRDNIAFGKADISDRALAEIIDMARCRSLINGLEGGVNAPVAQKGGTFSSGQRQLLSIARALANDPDLIIFDEATSYIDLETDLMIRQALANLTRNRTAIIIAHRLSTVRYATTILVLYRGRIIESGSHEALMNRKGYYFQLYQVQQAGLPGYFP
jgi:ATP-binding cassette subfamily B protein